MVKYQQEFLSQVESDTQTLIELHWEEIALNQDKIKLNPDWQAYHNLEAEGKLKIFTARDRDSLVGYFVVICKQVVFVVNVSTQDNNKVSNKSIAISSCKYLKFTLCL